MRVSYVINYDHKHIYSTGIIYNRHLRSSKYVYNTGHWTHICVHCKLACSKNVEHKRPSFLPSNDQLQHLEPEMNIIKLLFIVNFTFMLSICDCHTFPPKYNICMYTHSIHKEWASMHCLGIAYARSFDMGLKSAIGNKLDCSKVILVFNSLLCLYNNLYGYVLALWAKVAKSEHLQTKKHKGK
jgi:hypothetical protein